MTDKQIIEGHINKFFLYRWEENRAYTLRRKIEKLKGFKRSYIPKKLKKDWDFPQLPDTLEMKHLSHVTLETFKMVKHFLTHREKSVQYDTISKLLLNNDVRFCDVLYESMREIERVILGVDDYLMVEFARALGLLGDDRGLRWLLNKKDNTPAEFDVCTEEEDQAYLESQRSGIVHIGTGEKRENPFYMKLVDSIIAIRNKQSGG